MRVSLYESRNNINTCLLFPADAADVFREGGRLGEPSDRRGEPVVRHRLQQGAGHYTIPLPGQIMTSLASVAG